MADSRDISQLRQEYSRHELEEAMVHSNPMEQFKIWFYEALESKLTEPNAFILSTIDSNGFPASRTLLVKEIMHSGFIFYTNYQSDKGKELEDNPNAGMTFLWLELQRQVRIKGTVSKISRELSEKYFQSRPFESQLGAWASPQSQVIADRTILDQTMENLREKFKNQDVLPLPDFWGGYLLQPVEVEFWQGRMARLHDRIRYRKLDKEWKIERLAP